MDLSEGAILQHFVLERYLGKGGMGSAWAARDRRDGSAVALKILHRETAELPAARTRLQREAHATRAVAHPAIVPIVEVFEHEGVPVLVMELLQGETLRCRLVRQKRLPWQSAAEIVIPIAEALDAAHRAGIVHRDLKPENVFIQTDASLGETAGARMRLLDFGLARFFEPPVGTDRALTGLEDVIGTIQYMAPEQALHPTEVDSRVDIWALGVILYETLSACRPVEGETEPDTMRQLLLAAITPLEVLMPELPRPLVDLVTTMLARNPERRPQALSEVAERLSGLVRADAAQFGKTNG